MNETIIEKLQRGYYQKDINPLKTIFKILRDLDDNEIIPDISTDTVLKAVAMIESMLCENKNPRKEIITKTIDLRNKW